MDETIRKKFDELDAKKTEADLLKCLLREFPDLKISTDRWRRQRYTSRTVNNRATHVDFRHNCGCCPDSPLEARPYIETMGVQVFAQPDRYWVGERYDCYEVEEPNWERTMRKRYEVEEPNWERTMRKQEISEVAIASVRSYLEARKPPPYDDDDDDDEYDD